MANEIKSKFGASTAMTITLASLANGSARQSTLIDNTTALGQLIHVYFQITTGTSPTANRTIEVYLIKGDDPSASNIRVDNAGATDAAITIQSAKLIDIIQTTNTSNQTYRGSFVIQNPGKEWGLAILNNTGVALNATGSNHSIRYVVENPEVN